VCNCVSEASCVTYCWIGLLLYKLYLCCLICHLHWVIILENIHNIFLLAYLKTINMLCRHFYLIVLFYNINLGNARTIRSWYLKQLIWTTVTLLCVCCIRTVIMFLFFFCFATVFSTVVLFILTASVQLRMSTVYKRIWMNEWMNNSDLVLINRIYL